MKIRAAIPDDAPAIARVHVASWRQAYRGIVPQEFLDALDEEQRAQRWRDAFENDRAMKIAVAEIEGVICGFASGGPLRKPVSFYDGELYAIYIDPVVMRRGIGRALFDYIANHLAAQGLSHLLVWTLRDNPSTAFYERLGGVLVAEDQHEIGAKSLPTVAYGWPDFASSLPARR